MNVIGISKEINKKPTRKRKFKSNSRSTKE